MSLAVKPSTPIVLQFEGGKMLTLHADIAVRLFPKLAAAVKSLPVSVDKKDGQARAVLDLTVGRSGFDHLTLEEALKLASFACGGRYEAHAHSLYKRFGIPIPDVPISTVSLPSLPLHIKGSASAGALTVLAAKGGQDAYWVTGCKAVKTFGGIFPDMPDGFYAVATQTLQMEAGKFKIGRLGDLAHTFVLKVELDGPVDLDTLFESVSVTTGGNTSVEIDLQTNNALAKAFGLWPGKNNDAPRQPGQKWVATIPLVVRETTAYTKIVMPMIAIHYHDTEVSLKRIIYVDAKYALDVDYVYMDTASRRWITQKANLSPPEDVKHPPGSSGSKPPMIGGRPPSISPKPAEKPPMDAWDACIPQADWSVWEAASVAPADAVPVADQARPKQPEPCPPVATPPARSSGHELMFTQFQTRRVYLPPGCGKTRHIRLEMGHPTSGFMLTLAPEDPAVRRAGANIAPVVSASVDFNGNRGMEFDFADLTEWNWVKCGMKAPADFCTLLLPCSREMFWADQRQDCVVCPCTVNLSRLDSVVLTVTVNEDMFELCGWNMTITAMATNISVVNGGMQGVKYSR